MMSYENSASSEWKSQLKYIAMFVAQTFVQGLVMAAAAHTASRLIERTRPPALPAATDGGESVTLRKVV